MRPRLQRHPAVRHRPEHLSQGLRRCTQLVFEHHVPTFVQDAIPTPTIPKIQSHRVFLLCKVSGLPDCHSDTLRHSRSPFVLRLERVITGSLSHPAWRPAFSSHLVSTVLPVCPSVAHNQGAARCGATCHPTKSEESHWA